MGPKGRPDTQTYWSTVRRPQEELRLQKSRVEQVVVEGIQSVQCCDHLYVSISVMDVALIKWCTRIQQLELLMWEGYSTSIPLPSPEWLNWLTERRSGTSDLLRVYWCGAPSLTRGRICSLQLLLGLASAVFLEFESLEANDHILLSEISISLSLSLSLYIYIYILYIYIYTSGPRPGVAVALSDDGLALNVRLNDIVRFLDVFVFSRKNSSFTEPIVGLLFTSRNCVNTNRSRT
jgi:hypothetical protein